ncbi:MAG: FAD:protein FMN transferase [Anaerolineaceae bacterium]|nr:FAD:protein FMN transferase [Anaerolineaceae bacterium]
MNTDIVLAAEGLSEKVSAGFKQTCQFIQTSEKRFTRFSDQSELALLNKSSGSWCDLSQDLFEILQLCATYQEMTAGLFDPSILPDLEAAGYDRSMDEIRVHGSGKAHKDLPHKPGSAFKEIRFDADHQRVYLPDGMKIDLGGIAKGWIAQQSAHILAEYTRTCGVNAGGDMFLVGLPAGEKYWRVTLEDPNDFRRALNILKVGPGAVATSTTTRRRWVQDGQTQHHIIDPRTGQPAQTDFISVTVVAPSLAQAEVFAKAILICGSLQASNLVVNRPEVTFIAVDTQGKLWGSPNSKEIIDVQS